MGNDRRKRRFEICRLSSKLVSMEAPLKEKSKCNHREPLQIGYGFGRVSGWQGLGVTYRCPDCAECLWFEDDYECNDKNEIDHNAEKKKNNEKYKSWKSE